ncbi:unnamed protein product [Phaeothamnion confervicola]
MAVVQWVTEPHEVLQRPIGEEGASAYPPELVYDVFKGTVSKHGSRQALSYKKPGEEEWTHLTWQEYHDQCVAFAKSLMQLGFAPSRCINVLGFNSPAWFTANIGAIIAGGIAAGIYTTNLAEACRYISDHSEAEVVVVEGAKQLEKYLEISGELKHLKALVVYGEPVPERAIAAVPIYSFEDFLELGKEVAMSSVEERLAMQKPGNCCTLIYTSGTTGPPKAVMISHDNITWTTRVMVAAFPLDHTERIISYLPLSHIAAQILDMHAPLQLGIHVYFAQPDALRGSLARTLREVRPTVFFGVPRVWEKIFEKMQEIGKSTKGVKKRIATWAKSKGTEKSRLHQYGAGGGAPCGYGVASSVIFAKIKDSLGLSETKACLTAAAPISVEVLKYFASLDIPIYEVFGQSECTGPHTFNTIEAWKIGTCGRPMAGTETRIVPENGELCYRGRHIFMGYMRDAAKTAEAIDDDGWLHSGDVVEMDGDNAPGVPPPSGFLKITGRIKELIITAGGENVPPVIIETEFKKAMPALNNCMVIGDKRKFLSILLALKVEIDAATGIPTDKLTADALETSKTLGSDAVTTSEAAACPKWKEYLDGGLKAANNKSTSRAQIVQKWALIPTDFSEPGGELTPTLKLKRGPTAVKYEAIIEGLYAGKGGGD